MNPRTFCEEVVWLNVAYFHHRWDDVRLAFNAVASVDALAAQMYLWCIETGKLSEAECPRDTHYRTSLAVRSHDFRIVRDVAKLQKHAALVDGKPLVKHSRQVRSLLHGFAIEDMEGHVNRSHIVVLTGDEDPPVLLEVVVAALTFLEEELDRIGVPITRHHAGWEHRRRDRHDPSPPPETDDWPD